MYYLLIELSYLVQVTYGSNGRCRHHRCDKKTADSSDVKLGTVITYMLPDLVLPRILKRFRLAKIVKVVVESVEVVILTANSYNDNAFVN